MFEQAIDQLNDVGVISTSYLAHKFKVNQDIAKHILTQIVNEYENVKFRNEDQIFIEGRELEEWKPKIRIRKAKYIPKPTRWKDVTKP